MKQVFKTKIAMLLSVILCLSSFCGVWSFAANTDQEDTTATYDFNAEKKSQLIDPDNNRFEVSVEVPGGEGKNVHDEVIVMVDGSTSVDSEWPAMRDAVKEIGKEFLNGTGKTQLTLMAFGISPTVVKEHITSYEELEKLLNQYQGDLLYGRSGTNCSAAFDGIADYITKHDESLNDAYVIYISDGRVNLNNTPYVWKDCVTNVLTVGYAADAAVEEILGVYDFAEPSEAYLEVFGDKYEELTNLAQAFFANPNDKNTLNAIYAIVNEETADGITKAQLWASLVFEDVFAYAGLNEETAYPMHVIEKAFMDYKNKYNTNCQEAFYCASALLKDNYNNTANGQACAISAAQSTAKLAEEIFLVRYNPNYKSAWMENVDRDNVNLVDAGVIGNISAVIKDSVAEYITTPFNNVVVTDYMSKWVNLELDTLKIVDKANGTTVWTAKDGWLINENRPTNKEIPVIVELIDPSEYANGGEDVTGNTSGNIYKLTWYVKDGALLRSDNYKLVYEVVADVEEEGFQHNVNYPANGNTDLHYVDENDDEQTKEIKVPDIYADADPANVSLEGIKYMDNEAASGFEFQLILSDGTVLETVVSDEDGKFVFETLVFEQEGTYRYTVKEVLGTDDTILYDETVYAVTIEVKLEDGQLKATVSLQKDDLDYEGQIEFYNESLTQIPDEEIPEAGPEENPKTGDSLNSVYAIMVTSGVLVIADVAFFKKRRFCKKG